MEIDLTLFMKLNYTFNNKWVNMDLKSIEREIIIAASRHDLMKIRDQYVELVNQRGKMDKWFTKFIDMFDEKLSNADRNDPVKKLYNSKYDEYVHLNRTIKIAEHYMNER